MNGLPLFNSSRHCWLNYQWILLGFVLAQAIPHMHAQTEPIEVDAFSPPTVTLTQPSNTRWLNLEIGSATELIWTVSGTKPIRYILLQNGNAVKEQDNGNFHIDVSSTPLVTEYALKAVNAYGEAKSKTVVIKAVVNPPVIQEYSRVVSVVLGEPLELKINATGFGLRYQWHKELWPIRNETNSSLVFQETKREDEGEYLLAVSNYKGIELAPIDVVFSVRLSVLKNNGIISIEADSGELEKTWILQRSPDLIRWEFVGSYFVPGHLIITDIQEDNKSYYYRMRR